MKRNNRAAFYIQITAFLLGALYVANSCTDAGLQPLNLDTITYYDNKLALEGRFCNSPADEVAFPVKLLIVMDQSASLQCTDPADNRIVAMDQAANDLDALPNVEFGVIGFASWTRVSEFTPNWSDVRDLLAPQAGQGGPATDYQGSLSTALRVLEQDMIDSGPAIRARTKYIVLFISDGIPEPRCTAGCNDGGAPPDSLYGVCNTTQEIPDDVYVDMFSLCPDYNQPEQISAKVEDIMSLSDFYGVGDLSLSTILLFAPDAQVQAICGDVSQFGYDRDVAEPILRGMSEAGLGTFRDVNISTELDFLEFNYESLLAPYRLSEFFAINLNTLPADFGAAVDSDGDGVDDETEFANQMNRFWADTDGDLFSDLFELQNIGRGFDPVDGMVPAMGCIGSLDRDGDGLLECEENFLGLDPLLADTDGDRIPDGIELRLGMDPAVHDSGEDYDFDGRFSAVEVRAGTSPLLADDEDALADQVIYAVDQFGERLGNEQCYSIDVQNISLVTTLPTETDPNVDPRDWQSARGDNFVLLFALEEPANMAGTRGRYKVACVHARYLGETFKDPPDGTIKNLDESLFHDLPLFDPRQHCRMIDGRIGTETPITP